MAISLEEKAKQTIRLPFGEVPRWQDCNWCKAKLSCPFDRFAYAQPCDNCRDTERYEKEVLNKPKERSMQDIIDANKVASVFEGNGRTYYVNHKGNVIKDEPTRPLEVGKKDWK